MREYAMPMKMKHQHEPVLWGIDQTGWCPVCWYKVHFHKQHQRFKNDGTPYTVRACYKHEPASTCVHKFDLGGITRHDHIQNSLVILNNRSPNWLMNHTPKLRLGPVKHAEKEYKIGSRSADVYLHSASVGYPDAIIEVVDSHPDEEERATEIQNISGAILLELRVRNVSGIAKACQKYADGDEHAFTDWLQGQTLKPLVPSMAREKLQVRRSLVRRGFDEKYLKTRSWIDLKELQIEALEEERQRRDEEAERRKKEAEAERQRKLEADRKEAIQRNERERQWRIEQEIKRDEAIERAAKKRKIELETLKIERKRWAKEQEKRLEEAEKQAEKDEELARIEDEKALIEAEKKRKLLVKQARRARKKDRYNTITRGPKQAWKAWKKERAKQAANSRAFSGFDGKNISQGAERLWKIEDEAILQKRAPMKHRGWRPDWWWKEGGGGHEIQHNHFSGQPTMAQRIRAGE